MTTSDYLFRVKSVGIKQLKARLSEYVRLVKRGETVLVTDREEVVAEMRPPRRTSSRADHVEEALDALADAGLITRASAPKKGWTWKARGLGLRRGSAATLLDEIRGDRR